LACRRSIAGLIPQAKNKNIYHNKWEQIEPAIPNQEICIGKKPPDLLHSHPKYQYSYYISELCGKKCGKS